MRGTFTCPSGCRYWRSAARARSRWWRRRGDHRSLGIVCKTVAQAETLHRALSDAGVESALLDYGTTVFTGGIVVTSAHIAKGLEFDAVIVPHTGDVNYADEIDRCMLYLACTRAMHELHLTHTGPVSRFLGFTEHPGGTPGAAGTGAAEVRDRAVDVSVC
ncbi:ATP-binding domain-containing protein [Streptomyces nanhaiensis]|uniref:ATP-binding domain-containing protein n=1 Tax=Streptomyces nanhaiensis TaxID=679319 RepID=UPI00399CAA62